MPQTTTSPSEYPFPSRLSELIDQMADMLDESGVTLAELMADLPRIREEIYREQYLGEKELNTDDTDFHG